ncbi:MAG: 6-phospho-beta-glucosidase [Planctomycetes bacterium]|nr:6-phospho-beta-glucosidase [Planctomycetota bacterium]
MSTGIKIAIIGAGSSYTPELTDGLLDEHEKTSLRELAMFDIDPARLEITSNFTRQMNEHKKSPVKVVNYDSRAKALDGADFVVIQIRVGGQQARHEDIQLGLRHNVIGQETTGIGGMAKALRTIPVVLEICREIERVAPDAFVLNFSNPSGIVTEAIHKHSRVRNIGLCNIPIDIIHNIASSLSCQPEDVTLDYVGLNHLSWVRKIFRRGEDVTRAVLENFSQTGGPSNIPEIEYDPLIYDALEYIPSYYLRYFYEPERMLDELRAKPKSRAQEVMEIERKLFEIYKDQSRVTKPDELSERGGAWYSKLATLVIESIVTNAGKEYIVNVPSAGLIPGFSADQVIEVPCAIDRSGATIKTPLDPPAPAIQGLMTMVKCYESLTIDAAVERSYKKTFLALLTHPHVRGISHARAIVDDMNRVLGFN